MNGEDAHSNVTITILEMEMLFNILHIIFYIPTGIHNVTSH
jgi:hypothetical protein